MKEHNKSIEIVNAYVMQMLTEMSNNNHTHEVILALMDEFGDKRVYDELPWTFGKPELERIYKVLNETAFDNELRINLPIYYETLNDIDKIIRQYDPTDRCSGTNFYGLYHMSYDIYINGKMIQDIPDDYVLTGNEDIKFFNQKIFLNKDLAYDINFMMTVGCMAHEMIHQYAELHGEAKETAIEQSFMKMCRNSHTKPVFTKKYQQLLKDFGIDAMQSIGNKRREELNKQTYDAMITEDELLSEMKVKLIKNKNGQTCVDMRDVPPVNTPQYKEFTTGPCTRTILYID